MKKTPLLRLSVGTFILLLISVNLLDAQRRSRPGPGHGPGSWVHIGTTKAGFAADHDVIIVKGPFDNFRKIKFKVTNAGLNLTRLKVTYDNGAPDEIPVRENIRQGGESRAIDLRGGKRSIRKVEFWYDTKGILRGKARVRLYGMK
jgi:hypothetical protein